MIKLAWEDRERRAVIIRSPATITANAPEAIPMFRALSRSTGGAEVAVSTTDGVAALLAVSGWGAGGSDSFWATGAGAGAAAGLDCDSLNSETAAGGVAAG